MAHPYNSHTWEVEALGSIQNQPQLHSKFKASHDYVRLMIWNKITETSGVHLCACNPSTKECETGKLMSSSKTSLGIGRAMSLKK